MFKKTMLKATVAVAVIACVTPIVASAQWTHETIALSSGQNPNVTLEGPLSFTGGLGGISCAQTTWSAQLKGGQADALITSFVIDNPTGCTTQGALAFCQLHTVTFEATTNGGWTVHATTAPEDIDITKVEYQLHSTGSFCSTPTMQVHGNLTLVPDTGQAHALHQGKLQGTLQGTSCKTPGIGCNLGTATWSGSWTITPAKTYGIT